MLCLQMWRHIGVWAWYVFILFSICRFWHVQHAWSARLLEVKYTFLYRSTYFGIKLLNESLYLVRFSWLGSDTIRKIRECRFVRYFLNTSWEYLHHKKLCFELLTFFICYFIAAHCCYTDIARFLRKMFQCWCLQD